jgi:hypothetical protein
MGIGLGVFLIVVGAIFYGAIDVDLPYVNDDALGLIILLAGIAVVVVSVILTTERPEAGVGTGLVLIAVGAVLSFAVDADLPFIADSVLGIILMVGGAIAVIATVVVNVQRTHDRRLPPGRYHA